MTMNLPHLRRSRAVDDVNGFGLISGVGDPTVAPGVAADYGTLYRRSSEYQPKSVELLNEIFDPYDCVFDHAFRFQEAAAPALDLALTDKVSWGASGTPTFDSATGLTDYETDKGVLFDDNSADHLDVGSSALFDVGVGDQIAFLATIQHAAISAGTTGFFGKGDGGTFVYYALYTNRTGANGYLEWACNAVGGNPVATVAADHHHATNAFDALCLIDLASASRKISCTSNLGDSGLVDASAINAGLSNNGKLSLGQLLGIMNSTGFRVSFFAIARQLGSVMANRVAALARYTSARQAGTELYVRTKLAAATGWKKATLT